MPILQGNVFTITVLSNELQLFGSEIVFPKDMKFMSKKIQKIS